MAETTWSRRRLLLCLCKATGFNKKKNKSIQYQDIPSARRQLPHGYEIPSPKAPDVLERLSRSSESEIDTDNISDKEFLVEVGSESPKVFTKELDDLIRDLILSKELSELLGSRLKEKNLLASDTIFC